MILSAISFILFGLQVFLLPAQLYSYLEFKIDKPRLRFLVLVLSFIGFNALWIIMTFLLEITPSTISITLAYSGIFLIAHVYYYITKELSLTSKKYSAINLFLLLVFTELLRDSSLIVVAQEFLPYTKIFFFLVFQTIAILYATRLVRLIFFNENTDRSPIENAALCTLITSMFLPLVVFHVEVTSLYNVIINALFIVIAFAYFRHFVIKRKLEKRIFPHASDLGNNLQEQFVRVPEIFFEYDLSPREREISMYLLKGMSYEEISEKLYRTPGAIRKQGSQAYTKAGVKNLKEFRKKFEIKDGKISLKWKRNKL